MFGKKQSDQISDTVETVIGPSVKVEGDFIGEGDIIIEGTIVGNLRTNHNLRVGPQAVVEAEVKAANAFVAGRVDGNLEIDGALELASGAKINGDIICDSISVEAGASINGRVQMGTIARNNGKVKKATNLEAKLDDKEAL